MMRHGLFQQVVPATNTKHPSVRQLHNGNTGKVKADIIFTGYSAELNINYFLIVHHHS